MRLFVLIFKGESCARSARDDACGDPRGLFIPMQVIQNAPLAPHAGDVIARYGRINPAWLVQG